VVNVHSMGMQMQQYSCIILVQVVQAVMFFSVTLTVAPSLLADTSSSSQHASIAAAAALAADSRATCFAHNIITITHTHIYQNMQYMDSVALHRELNMFLLVLATIFRKEMKLIFLCMRIRTTVHAEY
jgi:hypothetical protein